MKYMDIQTEKVQLIEWLAGRTDLSVIEEIKAFKSRKESDWWDGLTREQQEDIEAGLADLNAGRKTEFDQVMNKYR